MLELHSAQQWWVSVTATLSLSLELLLTNGSGRVTIFDGRQEKQSHSFRSGFDAIQYTVALAAASGIELDPADLSRIH
jgi:hypothetical protein